MKILHVADLHADHDYFAWVTAHCVEYDLLVLAGDMLNMLSRNSLHMQARAVSQWLQTLQTPTVACTGNHDWWCKDPKITVDAYAEGEWLSMLRRKGSIIGVDGDLVEYHGLRISVNGWLQTPEADVGTILVTHAPIAGSPVAASIGSPADFGDPDLWTALHDAPPKLILCGHVHRPRKFACMWPPIDAETVVLVPGCDEQSPEPLHWIIDTEARAATHSRGETIGW